MSILEVKNVSKSFVEKKIIGVQEFNVDRHFSAKHIISVEQGNQLDWINRCLI